MAPLVNEDVQMPVAAEPGGVDRHPPLLRVLIVEDNPSDAKLTARVLESKVGKVQCDVTDSLDSFRESLERTPYDVIIADFNLRNWTALDALEILKQSGKDIPLIVVTGSLGDEAAVECIKQGAADFVLKDRPARLPTAVQRALKEQKLREDRRRAAEELSKSEERYRTLFERNLAGVFRTAWDGRILECNQAMAKILGVTTPGEVLNLRVQDLYFSNEDRADFLEKLETAGRLTNFELRLRRKDGSAAWLIGNIGLLPEAADGLRVIEGTLVDITERKLAEADNARLARIVNSSEDAIYSTTLKGNIVTWNAGAERMYGYAAKEIKGKHFSLLIPENRRGGLAANEEMLHRGEALVHYDTEHLRKNGSTLEASLTVSPIKDAAGDVSGVSVIARDITQSKRSEEALRLSEERFRTLFENAPVGIYRTTPDGCILAGNPAIVRMLGYSSFEELAARDLNATGFEPEYSRRQFMELLEKNGEVAGLESAWYRQGGDVLYVRENARAIRDDSGKTLYYEGTVEDITERKRAEAENARLVTAIEQSAEAVVITNPTGDIEYVNPAFTRITGYSPRGGHGKEPQDPEIGQTGPGFLPAALGDNSRKGRPGMANSSTGARTEAFTPSR